MGLGYDIFKRLNDGEAIWVGCADTVEGAKGRITALAPEKPGYYFVRCATTGNIVAEFDTDSLGHACA